VLEVTNEDTGESRTFELNAMFTFAFDGPRVEAIGHGSSMSFFLPGDLGEGRPGAMLYTRGQTDEVDEFPGPRPDALGATVISFTATEQPRTSARQWLSPRFGPGGGLHGSPPGPPRFTLKIRGASSALIREGERRCPLSKVFDSRVNG